ncbi:hypothetical protein CNR22_15390 [Sphingobacteriaceae bacterium]|nr:hypothetical protein CNR22_15390 [Sphingobacteriaceae bacterium]
MCNKRTEETVLASKNPALMKVYFILVILFFLPGDLLSQVTITIGTQETVVYPLTLNKQSLAEQLLQLKGLFSSKSIIGMGEATHGSREFFEIKSGVFQWLVEECNYRVFGIEATYAGCCYVNNFVKSGEGNVDSVMIHLDFWTWQTEEVRDLILWIKEYNAQAEHLEKISFYGFDMQNFYSPVQYLNDYVKKYYSEHYETIKSISFPILGKTELKIYQLLQNKKNRFEDTLRQTYQMLADWVFFNKNQIETKQSKSQFQDLQICIENLEQAVKNLSVNNMSQYRDSCMAYNILRIQKLGNKKMFIWAHNGHINFAHPDNNLGNGLYMGEHLKKNMGEAYYAIGFVFNQGSFQAIQGPKSIGGAIVTYIFARKKLYKGLQECHVPVNNRNTFTNALSVTKYPVYFTDVSHSENSVFSTILKTYDVGSIFMNYQRCSASINAKKQFDGLIFVEKTNRARPIYIK